MLKLHVPKGVSALYIEDIQGSGMGRGELEVILPPNTTIKQVKAPYIEPIHKYILFECLLTY